MGKVLYMRKGEVRGAPIVGIPLSSLIEGQIVNILENGKQVPFYLAKHDYEPSLNGTGRTLLVRKDCYDTRKWHSTDVNAYATSDIDKWLNSDYKNLLDPKVQQLIGITKFPYTIGNGNASLSTLQRSVFLLSATELGQNGNWFNVEGTALPIANTLKIAYGQSGSPLIQWTRTPCKSVAYLGACIDANGNVVYNYYPSQSMGSRPIFTLPETALTNPEPNPDGSVNLIIGETNPESSVERIVTFEVTDNAGALDNILGTVGRLTANDIEITASNLSIPFKVSKVTIRYVLNRTISIPRTVSVNGKSLGTVSTTGNSVSTTVSVLNGDTISIVFNK